MKAYQYNIQGHQTSFQFNCSFEPSAEKKDIRNYHFNSEITHPDFAHTVIKVEVKGQFTKADHIDDMYQIGAIVDAISLDYTISGVLGGKEMTPITNHRKGGGKLERGTSLSRIMSVKEDILIIDFFKPRKEIDMGFVGGTRKSIRNLFEACQIELPKEENIIEISSSLNVSASARIEKEEEYAHSLYYEGLAFSYNYTYRNDEVDPNVLDYTFSGKIAHPDFEDTEIYTKVNAKFELKEEDNQPEVTGIAGKRFQKIILSYHHHGKVLGNAFTKEGGKTEHDNSLNNIISAKEDLLSIHFYKPRKDVDLSFKQAIKAEIKRLYKAISGEELPQNVAKSSLTEKEDYFSIVGETEINTKKENTTSRKMRVKNEFLKG